MDRIGRYDVVRELGHGGMGSVYLGHDPELGRSVALKLLHRETTAFALKQEARTLAALNHPGIVTIFEIGEHDGRQFIAMEYLAGSSLRQLLQDAKPSRDELVAICAKVARAVAAAHRAGILHRDIKPENVVVGDDGVVKVVDFGIARRLHGDPSLTNIATATEVRPTERAASVARTLQFHAAADTVVNAATQTMFGTPAYMAPEILMGDPSTEPSDVYSLGVMLYECLAGRRPYESAVLYEVIACTIEGAPFPRLADPLAGFVQRMLAHDPSARPTLGEIAAALERTEAPVSASPPKRRRHIWPLALAGAAVVAAGAFGVWRETRPAAPVPAVQPARVRAAVAVRPLVVDFKSWGSEQPNSTALADVLAMLLRDLGVVAIPPSQLRNEMQRVPDLETAVRNLEAEYVVEGKLVENAGAVDAHVTIRRLGTSEQHALDLHAASFADLPGLMDGIALALAKQLDPGVRDLAPVASRARTFFDVGLRWKAERDWASARLYFEQAVALNPRYADAWLELASVRSWIMAPQAMTEQAIERAYALAPPGPHKQIWLGALHFYKGELARAIEILGPLQEQALADDDRRDLLYYLAEAYWHDGDHERAATYFRAVFDGNRKLKAAAVHLSEYAVARRRIDLAREMTAGLELSNAATRFAAGEYAELADGKLFPFNLHAQLVLERSPTSESEMPDSLGREIYAIARALERGDRAAARQRFAAMWPGIQQGSATDGVIYELEILGEVLLCAELTDELRVLLPYIASSTSPRARRALHRLSPLAAPLLGTRPALDIDMITRSRSIVTAINAELAGDRVTAVTVLDALVRDPTASWDYPERIALARNLHALGKTRELRALCDDLVRPAVFRFAFLPARATCRRLLR